MINSNGYPCLEAKKIEFNDIDNEKKIRTHLQHTNRLPQNVANFILLFPMSPVFYTVSLLVAYPPVTLISPTLSTNSTYAYSYPHIFLLSFGRPLVSFYILTSKKYFCYFCQQH